MLPCAPRRTPTALDRVVDGARRSPSGWLAGATTSSTTPISTALSTPPAIRSCSAASSASTCGPDVGGDLGQPAAVQDPDRGDGAHDGHLGARPGEDPGGAERAGVHGDVGAAVGLAGHQRDPGDHALAEGVQQLGAAAYDAVPLLADAGQVARHVDDHDQRDAERVAHPHEAGGLLGREGVQAAAETQRVVGDDADGATTEAAQRGDDVGGPASVQLLRGALVEDRLDQRVHVVGALPGLGEQRREVAVLDLVDDQAALGAEQGGDAAGAVEGLSLGLGEDVDDAGATAVGLGSAEAEHVDVLAGHRADHVGAGDEDPALGAEDHDVGERRAVRRAAGGRAEHHGDLRDLAGGLGHHLEDPADGVQREHALGEPGAAGVPEADDRHAGRSSPGGRRRRRRGSRGRPSRRP